jgi:fibronectin-binding autotransporter adhesin
VPPAPAGRATGTPPATSGRRTGPRTPPGWTAGVVTLTAPISVNTINFGVTGYNISNSGTGSLTLNGSNPVINTGGYNASIGAGVLKLGTGVTSFNKSGVGFLFLTGDNSGSITAGNTTLGIDGGALNTTTGLYSSGIVVDSGRANGAAPTTYNLNGGSIVFNSSSSLGFASSRTINVMAGGGAISDGGFVQGSANGAGAFVPNISITSGATLDVISSNNFAFDGGQGIISGAGGVTTYGTGTVQFLQANTYTGNTNISGGTVLVANTIAAIGTASSLGAGSGNLVMTGTAGSQNTNNSGAYLVFTGASGTTNRGLTLGGTVQNTINVSSGSGSLTISGQVTDLGSSGNYPRFYEEGAGTLTFTYAGGNSFNGYKFLVDGGVLNFTTAGQVDQFATDLIIGNQLAMASTNPVLNLNGATLNIGNISGVGNGFGMCNGDPNNNQVMTFNMSGGVLNTPTIYTDYNSTATGLQALMNISGGTINCSAGMYLQNIPSTTTVLTLSGSSTAFNVTGSTVVAAAGTSIVNQTGGTLRSTGTMTLASGGSATYNFGGGTLVVPQINVTGGTGVFNFNGGTLTSSGSTTTFITGLTSVNVQAGGATINTNGFNDTINQPLLNSGGTDGGLTKTGGGALTLTGVNTYNGPTNISAGTLIASASGNGLGSTTANLSVAGTLNLNGTNITAGPLTSIGGPAPANINTISTGDTLEFKVGAGTINTLTVSSATMSGATGIQIDTTGSTSFGPGTYTLVSSSGGGLTGNVVFAGGQNLTVPATQAIENIAGSNYRLTLASTGSSVTVTATAAPAKTISVMPLGSSITEGDSAESPYDGGGYRSQLYENLVNDGRFTPLFVGSNTGNGANNPTGPALIDAVGQSHNEGHSGWTTSQILSNLNAGGDFLTVGNGVNPDFVTINIGGNDYVGNPTDTGVIGRLGQIIDEVSALRPNATIIVSSVFYRGDGGGAAGNGIATLFDPFIPGLVYQHVLAGEHVEFLDGYNLLTPGNSLTYIGPDLVHPTQAGYDIYANAWYQSITTGQAFYTGNQGSSWSATSGSSTSWDMDFQRTTDSGVAPGSGTDVYFNGVGGTTTLGTNFSVRSLNFTAAAIAPVTIGGGSSTTLTLGQGGITVQAGSGSHTVTVPVALGMSQTWSNNATNLFTVVGNISGTGPLTIGGSGAILFGGGSNTYTGGTNLSSGTLFLGNTNAGSGVLSVAAGAKLFAGGTESTPISVSGTFSAGYLNQLVSSVTTGAETWNGGGHLTVDVATDGSSNDLVTMSSLQLASSPSNLFDVDFTDVSPYTMSPGQVLILATDTDLTSADPFFPATYLSATHSDLAFTFANLSPASGYAFTELAVPSYNAQQNVVGYSLELVQVPTGVPEPTGVAAVVAAGALLARRRRRA